VEYSYQELMNFKESIKDGFRKVAALKKKGSFLDWGLDLPELKDRPEVASGGYKDQIPWAHYGGTGLDTGGYKHQYNTALEDRARRILAGYANAAASNPVYSGGAKPPKNTKESSVIEKLASIGLAEVVKESGMKSELLGSLLVPGSAIGALTALFRKKPTLLQWLARNKHTASNFIPGVGGHRLVMRAKGEPDAVRIVEKAVNGLSLSDLVKKLL